LDQTSTIKLELKLVSDKKGFAARDKYEPTIWHTELEKCNKVATSQKTHETIFKVLGPLNKPDTMFIKMIAAAVQLHGNRFGNENVSNWGKSEWFIGGSVII